MKLFRDMQKCFSQVRAAPSCAIPQMGCPALLPVLSHPSATALHIPTTSIRTDHGEREMRLLLTLVGGLGGLRDVDSELATEGVHPHHSRVDRGVGEGGELVVVAGDAVERFGDVCSSFQDYFLQDKGEKNPQESYQRDPDKPLLTDSNEAVPCQKAKGDAFLSKASGWQRAHAYRIFPINPDICGNRAGSLSPSGHTLYKKTNWQDGAGAWTCSTLELSLGGEGKVPGGKT